MSIALRDQLIKSMIFQFGEQCRESLSSIRIDETRRDERASREDKGEDGERKMHPPSLSAREESVT